MKIYAIATFSLAAGFVLTLGGAARADIVTYDTGKVMKGIVRDLPNDPDAVQFTGSRMTMRLLRSRIQKIEKEPVAMGYIHIGNEFREAGKFPEAIGAYNQALKEDPANAEAQRQIDQTQADIDARNKMSREQALAQIETLTAAAREAVQTARFADAEKSFQQANDLVPSPEQKQKLAKEISQMYLAWGKDRLDKFDTPAAEDKFNLAVQADPDNSEAIKQLLTLWEGNPEKREQAAHIYETLLDRHPDNDELRKKLGDLYAQIGNTESMVQHYLLLYKKSDKWQGTPMEKQLVAGLSKLQAEYARKKDYDQAIRTYKLLAALDPNTDPTAVVYYQYLKMAGDLKADDFKGRLALAQFAEKNGLDTEALEKYRSLAGNADFKEQALAGIARYANRDLALAQQSLDARNYSMARTLADDVRKRYVEVKDINEKATEIIGRADAQMQVEARQRGDMAKDVLRAADEYYQQATMHFQALFNRERIDNPLLVSDRLEAKKYYALALQAYQQALQMNPALANQPLSVINVRIAECRSRLASLNQGPSGGLNRDLQRLE